MVAKRAGNPGAANWVLKTVRLLVRFAIGIEVRQDDPTQTIKRFPLGEHRSWTDDEIAAFEARWLIGTKERTAFALFLYTGQRLSDVRRMSWRDLDGNGINVRQQKTSKPLWIPLHPSLAAIIEQWPRSHIAIMTTNFGKPYTVSGFGEWMARNIDHAGLPVDCVTHGLRKAAARRLAEAGCTAHQIMSITGQSLKEVERYTRAVEQRKLAQAGIDQLANKNSQP
jgi:integrase